MSSPRYCLKEFDLTKTCTCPLDLHDIGSEPATATVAPPNSPAILLGSKDSKRSVPPPEDSTGNYSSLSQRTNESEVFAANSVDATGSPVDLKRRNCMSGKKTPASKAPNSKSEADPSKEILKQIGDKCFQSLRQEYLTTFPRTSIFDIIAPCAQSLVTTLHALESKRQLMSFMEPLELESLDELGLKGEWKLTVKIHDPR